MSEYETEDFIMPLIITATIILCCYAIFYKSDKPVPQPKPIEPTIMVVYGCEYTLVHKDNCTNVHKIGVTK